jgi:hypothetical protein
MLKEKEDFHTDDMMKSRLTAELRFEHVEQFDSIQF